MLGVQVHVPACQVSSVLLSSLVVSLLSSSLLSSRRLLSQISFCSLLVCTPSRRGQISEAASGSKDNSAWFHAYKRTCKYV